MSIKSYILECLADIDYMIYDMLAPNGDPKRFRYPYDPGDNNWFVFLDINDDGTITLRQVTSTKYVIRIERRWLFWKHTYYYCGMDMPVEDIQYLIAVLSPRFNVEATGVECTAEEIGKLYVDAYNHPTEFPSWFDPTHPRWRVDYGATP